jgi:hypothetical protein
MLLLSVQRREKGAQTTKLDQAIENFSALGFGATS